MGVGRADKIAKEHAGQLDVIDIVALALGKARILDALAGAADALELGGAVVAVWGQVVHSAASLAALIVAAAASTDLTMF